MAKSSRLTPIGIERTRPKDADVWLSDDEGTRGGGRLVVRISPSGAKNFYFRYSIHGKRSVVPIGPFTYEPTIGKLTLEAARAEARKYAALYRDPATRDVATYLRDKRAAEEAAKRAAEEAERRQFEEASAESKYTLKALCEWYVKHLKDQGKPSGAGNASLFRCHVYGTEWASHPARTFTARQATALLRRIVETGKGRTAAKVRSALHSAYSLAIKAELDPTAPADLLLFGIESNPIASTAAMSKFNKPRDRALSHSELGALWRKLTNDYEEVPLAVRGLRLALLLGGQRAQQLLRVRRKEDVNLEAGEITLYDPKGRRAVARAHTLPLLPEARKEVEFLVKRSKAMDSEWLFASREESHLGSDVLSDLVREISNEFVAGKISQKPFQFNDMRRTAETMLASLRISKDIRAQLQSHGLSGVQTRHYDRYEYMDEKRAALEKWESFLAGAADGSALPSNVRPLRPAA